MSYREMNSDTCAPCFFFEFLACLSGHHLRVDDSKITSFKLILSNIDKVFQSFLAPKRLTLTETKQDSLDNKDTIDFGLKVTNTLVVIAILYSWGSCPTFGENRLRTSSLTW